jgi:thiamine biosynthesis lipoprotein ApbE
MGTMMSAAVWGADTARLARALDALRDSVERRPRVGFDSLRGEIRQRTGVALAADSGARGAALDRAGRVLAGVADSALLDLGGQFLWVGARDTRRTVGIADPDNSLEALATVEMRAGSVRTASRPGRKTWVTVLAASGIAADAWATAFFAIGCDRALALAPRLERWRMSVVCADSGHVRWTPDLDGRVLLPTGAGRAGVGPPAPAP